MKIECEGKENHTLLEMARIGKIDDNIELMVYGYEGTVPHFHFEDTKNTNRLGCIRIDCAKYFKYGKYQSE